MTLPNATLFPQALAPLYIFEPRYRQMLADVLETHRMFALAMQRPGCVREIPAPVAGLGMVRVCVGHRDGTSHLVLQGVARVELLEAVRYKPYRLQRVRVLETPPADNLQVDALVAKVRELLAKRLQLGLPWMFTGTPEPDAAIQSPTECSELVAASMLDYVDGLQNPEHVADLVSGTVLRCAQRRQAILETVELVPRLQRLILFLEAEIREYQDMSHE